MLAIDLRNLSRVYNVGHSWYTQYEATDASQRVRSHTPSFERWTPFPRSNLVKLLMFASRSLHTPLLLHGVKLSKLLISPFWHWYLLRWNDMNPSSWSILKRHDCSCSLLPRSQVRKSRAYSHLCAYRDRSVTEARVFMKTTVTIATEEQWYFPGERITGTVTLEADQVTLRLNMLQFYMSSGDPG